MSGRRVQYAAAGRAAREVMAEACRLRLSGHEYRVLLAVLAVTVTYSKVEDRLFLAHVAAFAYGTERAEEWQIRKTREALRSLEAHGLVWAEAPRGRPPTGSAGPSYLVGIPTDLDDDEDLEEHFRREHAEGRESDPRSRATSPLEMHPGTGATSPPESDPRSGRKAPPIRVESDPRSGQKVTPDPAPPPRSSSREVVTEVLTEHRSPSSPGGEWCRECEGTGRVIDDTNTVRACPDCQPGGAALRVVSA